MNDYGYLLDTNMQEKLPATICTSIVVAAEVEFGLSKGVSARMHAQVQAIIGSLEVLPLAAPVQQHYGQIRALLAQQRQPIGPNDLFIAAHARALGMTLVSQNLREFERVPGLQLEDWLAADDATST